MTSINFHVKGHCQTANPSTNVFRSISLDRFPGNVPISVHWMQVESRWSLSMFKSKIKVKLLVFEKCVVLSLFLNPLLELESCLAWYNECQLKVNNPYGCSYHMCKGQGQTGGLWQNVWSIFKTSITWQWLNLDQ